MTAGVGVDGVVAGVGEGVGDAEAEPFADDLGFGHLDEGSVDVEGVFARAFDAGFGGEVGDLLKGVDEGGAAIGVAGVVDGVDADEEVEGVAGFGEGEGEAEEDGVPGGDIGDRDLRFVCGGDVVFGDGDVGGEGNGASESAEIDFQG